MAKVDIIFCSIAQPDSDRPSVPVVNLKGAVTHRIVSSGVSQATTTGSTRGGAGGFVEITVTGNDVWITAGPTPIRAAHC